MSDLAERLIVSAVDARFDQLRRREPYTAYGIVQAVNRSTRQVNVYVSGNPTASGGFVYPPSMWPMVGERVRVVIDPRGDRYVDAYYASSVIHPEPTGGQNLLKNTSFEGGLTGWTNGSANPANVDTRGGTFAREGANTLRWGAVGYGYIGIPVGIVLHADYRYTMSFWIKSAGTGAVSANGAGFVLEGFGTGVRNSLLTYENGTTATSTTPNRLVAGVIPAGWTRYATSWIQHVTMTTGFLLTNSYGGSSTGEIFFDCLQLEEGPLSLWREGRMS